MAISMQMNINLSKMVSTTSKFGFKQKPYNNKVQAISCRADNLAMQRGKSNFYEVLSLDSENVGLAEIKKAYRRMVLQYHPDVCPPSAKEESTKRFLELQMAYETLSDPVSRKMYDYDLGLVDPIGYGVWNCLMEERRSKFPRDAWEKQVDGLKKRSHVRMQRMKNRSRQR
ncbi:chaperone protein dnaJ 20, chloroplastic-like [Durio zibethinus]|uniref:Chaperone protein dnaJ 20, chloroplastic-like n=1 Tax=Durio zibethinus TaxID=66656 RepID=A0A6P5YKN6_DURZI|nr:chaperone protein dnaJ 20, chloroplastic-like [Durio zibethinus]